MSRSKKEKNMTKLRGDVPKKLWFLENTPLSPEKGVGSVPKSVQLLYAVEEG